MDWGLVIELHDPVYDAEDHTCKIHHWLHEPGRKEFQHWYAEKHLHPCKFLLRGRPYRRCEHDGYHDHQNHLTGFLWCLLYHHKIGRAHVLTPVTNAHLV